MVLALKNVLRHGRRSWIALSAIGFGVAALILAAGFIEWILWGMREATVESRIGHIQVVRSGYEESGAADPNAFLLPTHGEQLRLIEALPEVRGVSPRLGFTGLISVEDSTLSFVGEGIDAKKEGALFRGLVITAGHRLADDDELGILVGEGLAANLGAKIGDRIVLLTTTAGGSVNAVEGHLRGQFSTLNKAYDAAAVHVPLRMAQRLLRTDQVHQWIVLLRQTELTDRVADNLRQSLPDRSFDLIPWYRLTEFYNRTVELFSRQMTVVKLIVALIIVLGISNTLVMSVLERISEIGTSMALGTPRAAILRQFVAEGMLLGVIGAGAGALVGVVAGYVISEVGIPMPPPPGSDRGYTGRIMINAWIVLQAFGLGIGTALAASIFPALKASRFVIVDALRHSR